MAYVYAQGGYQDPQQASAPPVVLYLPVQQPSGPSAPQPYTATPNTPQSAPQILQPYPSPPGYIAYPAPNNFDIQSPLDAVARDQIYYAKLRFWLGFICPINWFLSCCFLFRSNVTPKARRWNKAGAVMGVVGTIFIASFIIVWAYYANENKKSSSSSQDHFDWD
jgi:hypothetical protein